MRLLFVISLFTIIVFAGCGGGQTEGETAGSKLNDTVSSNDTTSSEIIASVNDWQLTVLEFEAILNRQKEAAKEHGLDIDNPMIKRRFLDQMVRKEVLYRVAQLLGIDKDPQLKAMPEEAQKNALAQAMQDILMKDVEVGEEDVKHFHQQNKESFSASFSESKGAIKMEIERVILQRKIAELLERFKDQIEVSVNYDLLNKI
jgi:hypothetical protein